MVQIGRSSDHALKRFYDKQGALSFSYPEVGATRGEFPAGYDHDRNGVLLGRGELCFEAGRAALRAWRMFPTSWVRIFPAQPSVKVGDWMSRPKCRFLSERRRSCRHC